MNTGVRVYVGRSRVTWPGIGIPILLVCLASIWIGGPTWGAVATGVGIALGLAFLMVAHDRQIRAIRKIEVSDTHVSGQSGSPWDLFRRISIARNHIDFERSSRPSFWWRLFRSAHIWSTDGRHIVLDYAVLGKDQGRQILRDLGIEQVDV